MSFHYHNRVRSYNRILLFLTAINLLYYWGQRRKTTSGNMWWKIDKRGGHAQAGETPAHPNVESLEKVRPTAAYMITIDDIKEFPKCEKIWKDIFQIR